MRRSASGGVPRQLAGLVRGDGLHTHDLPPYDQRAERPYDHSALGPVGNRQSLVSSPSHPQVSPRFSRQRSEPGSAPTDADQDTRFVRATFRTARRHRRAGVQRSPQSQAQEVAGSYGPTSSEDASGTEVAAGSGSAAGPRQLPG